MNEKKVRGLSDMEASWVKANVEVWIGLDEAKSTTEAFHRGKIIEIKSESMKISVKDLDANTVVDLAADKLFQVNRDSQDGYDDMVNMENLNEAELLFNIKKRFERQSIFTYVGPTLLVVNPYMKIPELFSEKTLTSYQDKILSTVFSLKDAPPHVYALALLAIRQLSETNRNQAIVISGESGAGKTENTKFAMKFLTSVGKASYEQKENFRPLFKERKSTLLIVKEGDIDDNRGGEIIDLKAEKRKSGKTDNFLKTDTSPSKRASILKDVHMEVAFEGIEDKILSCNPVLEAFGNAKTSRNDNSSRFGKLVLLLVHKDTKKIKGAVMTNYLLEKSRVILQGQGERNYHVFYHLLKGADKEVLKDLELKDMKTYEYLKNSGCYDVPTVNDIELYKDVCKSFKVMHFSNDEQQAVWGIVASVLHLGNCGFDDKTSDNNTPCQITNKEGLKVSSRLLGITEEELVQAFTYRIRVIGNQHIKSKLSKTDCLTLRDSFTKGLYERLFNWIVKRLNWAISTPEYRNMKIEALIQDKNRYSIGLLDIFGFEVFKKNNFEQFCINFANEKLQQLYISYVFKGEIKEFIDEGLKDFLYELTFKDNQPIIDLFENYPSGIFHLLDESTSVQSSDDALLSRLVKEHKGNENFRSPKISGDTFIIIHTAKDVEYSITGFRMKNKDELSSSIMDSMSNSKLHCVKRIFFNALEGDEIQRDEDDDDKAKPGAKAKKSSSDKFLGAKFRLQMKDLMTELNSCDVHFIRCIKPNEEKKKELFIPTLSLTQIRYLGVLDSIRVRKESYPVRKLYKNFYQVYGELDPVSSKISFLDHCKLDSNFRDLSKEVISQALPGVGTDLILFGQRKIFMRIQITARLDKILAEKIKKKNVMALRVQKGFFRYQQRKKLKVVFKSIRRIQMLWRCRFEYQKFKKFCKALRRLQNWGRKINFKNKLSVALDKLRRGRKGLIRLQARIRMKCQRKIYLQFKNSVELINRCVKRFLAKLFVCRMKICRRILMDKIFELAWKNIRKRWEKDAAVIIQKYARGYLIRKKHKDKVKKIRLAVLDFKMKKASHVIQRFARGFLVRNRIRKLHQAAFKIQGFVKMKWLSGLFQSLRKNVRIIQRCVRKFLINKRIMKERWTDYKSEDIKQYEVLRNLEKEELFGKKDVISSSSKTNQNGSVLSFSPSNLNLLPNHELDTEEEFLKFLEREQEEIDDADLDSKRDTNHETIDESIYEEIVTYNYKVNETENSSVSSKSRLKQTHEESDVSLNRKIVLFSLVVDLDLIGDTTELYKPLWSNLFNQAKKDAAKSDSNFQIIEVGETFTAAVTDTGKIYTWGWNDFNQLGRYTDPQGEATTVGPIESDVENLEPHKLVAGDNHCFVLDKQRNVYSWGDNFNGQLGMGSNKIVSRITHNKILPPRRVIDVQSKGVYNVAILEDGKVLNWPFQKISGKYIYKPVEMPLPQSVSITSLSCGNNFVMLLSTGGLLYSFGRDNSEGQLGHGDTNPRTIPTLIQKLKSLGEKVHKVSCGFKHVVCRTGLGKIYTWGAGDCGQLGTGHLNNETVPRVINTDRLTSLKSKVVQIKAGFRSCMVLLENAKVFWWGTNSALQKQAAPVRLDFSQLIQCENEETLNDYLPIRLCSSWNKTLGLLYITIADTTRITESKLLTRKLCNILSSKWEDQTIYPPYIESISRHFTFKSLNRIRINAATNDTKFLKLSPKGMHSPLLSPKRLTREEKEKVLNLFNLPEVTKLSSPNQKSLSRVCSGPGSLLRGKSPTGIERVIEKNKEERLKQIKTKIITLMKTPREFWTPSEHELMRVLSDPKVLALIKKI